MMMVDFVSKAGEGIIFLFYFFICFKGNGKRWKSVKKRKKNIPGKRSIRFYVSLFAVGHFCLETKIEPKNCRAGKSILKQKN